MVAWPAKDPDAVLDYVFTIPLDEGDTVASYDLVLVDGTVVIDSDDNDGADVTAWLSGGTAGETNVFRIEWTTAGGRTDERIVTLAIVDQVALELDGYAKPSAADLKARYPAFADVADATVQSWLTDAERNVDTTWIEADYPAALMAHAAHAMAMQGIGAASGAGALPAGVTRFKSGAMDVTVSEAAASAQAKGGYAASPYGREFARLQRRSFGGPRAVAGGTVPSCGCGYPVW